MKRSAYYTDVYAWPLKQYISCTLRTNKAQSSDDRSTFCPEPTSIQLEDEYDDYGQCNCDGLDTEG
jgi:ferredoxin-thioredoxin reductase catalytic subunit